MSLRLFVLVNVVVVVAMTLGIAFLSGAHCSRSDQIERPPAMLRGDRVLPRDLSRNQDTSFARSKSLFLLKLLKLKLKYSKIQVVRLITTTTEAPTTDNGFCVCVPFYLCSSNQTVITDGSGVIDVRFQRCFGPYDVCCFLPNATSPWPTWPPWPPWPTLPTWPTRPTGPTGPTGPTIPTRPTGLPTRYPNCVCVDVSQCGPNGIISISGEGVLDPRFGYGLCPGVNQVCCRIQATTTQRSSTTSTATTTSSPGQLQMCFVCGNSIQCITCGVSIGPGGGVINPRFPMSQTDLCSRTSEPLCPDTIIESSVEDLGPLKNQGTSQACYCIKSWMCSEENVVSPDGLGVIDSRFTSCSSADQVCCRSTGIDVQIRNGELFSSSPELFVARNGSLSASFSHMICGTQDSSYAPSQPLPAGKTYFAEFPWMVALMTKSTSKPYAFKCGASMISNRAVLTAAHCVINVKPENLLARFGQWNIGSNTQSLPVQEANILQIITHPTYYSGGLFHDVAVLVLEKEVVYSANVLPICLPEQGMTFTAGTKCYGTGWGSDSLEGNHQAELRKVEVPIVDHAECQTRLRSTRLGQHFQLHGSFICAGGEANKDTCRGDGGGPLTCQAATGQFYQAGIVSWGIGCGASNVPAVYASVSQHRQWIDKQLATYGV